MVGMEELEAVWIPSGDYEVLFRVGRGDLDIHDLWDTSRDHISRGHECIESKTMEQSLRRATRNSWAHSVEESDKISSTQVGKNVPWWTEIQQILQVQCPLSKVHHLFYYHACQNHTHRRNPQESRISYIPDQVNPSQERVDANWQAPPWLRRTPTFWQDWNNHGSKTGLPGHDTSEKQRIQYMVVDFWTREHDQNRWAWLWQLRPSPLVHLTVLSVIRMCNRRGQLFVSGFISLWK